jgi:hypothetical protein
MHVEVKDPDGKVRPLADAPWGSIEAPGTGACGAMSPNRAGLHPRVGGAVPAVWLRGPLHFHLPHARRPPDLPALQLHQDGALRWWQAGKIA